MPTDPKADPKADAKTDPETDPDTERGVVDVVYDGFEFVGWIWYVVCDPMGALLGVLFVLGLTFCFGRRPSRSARRAILDDPPAIPHDQPCVDREHEARHVAIDPWGALNKKIVRRAVPAVVYKVR